MAYKNKEDANRYSAQWRVDNPEKAKKYQQTANENHRGLPGSEKRKDYNLSRIGKKYDRGREAVGHPDHGKFLEERRIKSKLRWYK